MALHPALDKGWSHSDAPRAVAFASLARASALYDAYRAIKYEIAHGALHLDPALRVQRNKILELANSILDKAADDQVEEFLIDWKEYKRMTS